MSKQLLIIRHASAAWPEDVKSDFERPLKKKGIKEAEDLGVFLKHNHIVPDLIACSPSKRTKQTFNLVNQELKIPVSSIVFEETIYEASYKTLFKIVNNLNNSHHLVALVGHNNGISDLLNYLSNGDEINLPPAGIALLEFPFHDWKMVSNGLAEIKLLHYPED
ncbi:putative phosphohistidine phosphatase, SixA [Pseudopedobacter saltans DSM 12145]|uniref:Phosphohistidine phosphatase, SixA n=1 Tax=Pseudopedobacter saltans (strain ATCC 51119 / DSM 12145 / JCM 21818 / CCUG 39354 / LMG 10337 / NBRC 100064 / NCIMB 13643) TaxID=762903 RepID=F0SB25_PSESL|nr:histidine phosphatase family protein [Pseudopedobacter saltans]ADY52660.1 putative phosphohistidine phosphatase, SixA [Pseudopedobacter saltans DSM 12145]